MYLEEFGFHHKNLKKILYELAHVHKTSLDLSLSKSELEGIYEANSEIKTRILLESPYNAYFNNSEYTKATLICEAVRIFLSEIRPARRNAKVKTKKMQKMGEATDPNILPSESERQFIDNIESQEGLVGSWVPLDRFNTEDFDMIDQLEKEGRLSVNRKKGKIFIRIIEGLITDMIRKLDDPKHYNKLVEAASSVSRKGNVPLQDVFKAYERASSGSRLHKSTDDPAYHRGLAVAFSILQIKSNRQLVESAQRTLDEKKELYTFLINKAKDMGETGKDGKRFILAAHNALMNADLKRI